MEENVNKSCLNCQYFEYRRERHDAFGNGYKDCRFCSVGNQEMLKQFFSIFDVTPLAKIAVPCHTPKTHATNSTNYGRTTTTVVRIDLDKQEAFKHLKLRPKIKSTK